MRSIRRELEKPVDRDSLLSAIEAASATGARQNRFAREPRGPLRKERPANLTTKQNQTIDEHEE